jgi:hypothetical protein
MATTTGETELATTSGLSADSKIRKDLGTLKEKMDLCNGMLNPGADAPSFSTADSTMLAVVGFLEACAPRMVELVEVAAMGAVSEEVLMECLQMNDQLQKQLTDIQQATLTESSASTTAASAPSSETQQFEDLLLDDGGDDAGDDGAANFTIDDDDEDEEDEAKPAAKPDDDFDAFFAERTGGS